MKLFIALVLVATSLAASAQSGRGSVDGRIVMRDGRSIIRINVGDDRDANQNQRIRRLEEAVRDLQAQVYDLQDSQVQTRVATTHVCSLKTSFDGTFIGKASTRIEAEALARQKCDQGNGTFCSSTSVKCEVVQEEVVIR